MAKKQNGRNVARKKFSFNERVQYHKTRYEKFVDSFRPKTGGMTSDDFDKIVAAEKRNPKMQYSSGYCDFVGGIGRGYVMSEADLKKESKGFQRGYSAAKKAYDYSRNFKF